MSAAPVPAGSAPPRDRTEMTRRTGETWRPPRFSPPGRKPYIDILRRFFDLQAGSIWRDLAGQLPQVRGNVLDVGCGAQPYRELLPSEASYHGIDTADAKENFGYQIPDTTYFEGEVWPVADQSVDFILCTETLEHVPDPRKLLAQAARCLKPGGQILLTTPFSARWHFIPHDYWRYTPSSLAILLNETGFVRTEVYARGNAVTVACYKAMALVLRLLMPQGFGIVGKWALRLVAIPLIPFFILLAAVANVSLLGRGGDDCLGYTAIAVRI